MLRLLNHRKTLLQINSLRSNSNSNSNKPNRPNRAQYKQCDSDKTRLR